MFSACLSSRVRKLKVALTEKSGVYGEKSKEKAGLDSSWEQLGLFDFHCAAAPQLPQVGGNSSQA